MSGIIGALKGASIGVLVLVFVGLVPGVAGVVAYLVDARFETGFLPVFFATLGLEALVGVSALFGAASEVQQSHAESVARSNEPSQPS